MDPTSKLNYIVTHVILPPQLLQKDDSGFHNDAALLQHIETALSDFRALCPPQQQSHWTTCKKMVRNMLRMRDHGGNLIEEEVKVAFKTIEVGGMISWART
jgi:hypothetical protein